MVDLAYFLRSIRFPTGKIPVQRDIVKMCVCETDWITMPGEAENDRYPYHLALASEIV